MLLIYWLLSWFGNEKAYASSQSSVRQRTYCKQLEQELTRQQQQAKKMQENAWHWGDNGDVVERAINQLQSIVAWPETENPAQYFARVLAALDALKQRWRESAFDEAGYGVATVIQFERLVQSKQPLVTGKGA